MAQHKQRWLSKHDGKSLPKGVRIRTCSNGGLRLYVRHVNEHGKQVDLRTEWDANNPGDIDRATAHYYELRKHILTARAEAKVQRANRSTGPASVPPEDGDTTKGTVADVLAIESAWFHRPGKTRSADDIRSWNSTASALSIVLGAHTPIVSLTHAKLHQFVIDRMELKVRGDRRASADTAFRNLQVLRSAIKRAQEEGRVPPLFAVRWPRRKDFDRQSKDHKLTANVIPREIIIPFFAQLEREVESGADKSDWGRCVPLMFKMALHTGMRAGELQKLRVRDVEPGRIFIHPKHGDPDWFYQYGLRPFEIAQRVIQIRGLAGKPDALLFVPDANAKGAQLKYSHAQVARRASKRLGLNMTIKLRDMRATAGRREYDGQTGVKDIQRAQMWLRHSTVSMTITYLRIQQDQTVRPADDLTAI